MLINMNGAHFHLIVNHVPIIGSVIGMLILLTGVFLKDKKVMMTGLGTLVFTSLSISIVLFTGDPAGDAVKGLPGVTESMIEHHEDIAYSSLWAVVPMGLFAALALYSLWKDERSGKALALTTLVLALIAIGMMTWVGLTGGEIRHTEIRSGNAAVQPAMQDNQQESDED